MNRSLRISKGASRLRPVRSGKISWAKLSEKLLDFVVTPETYAEYMAMPADQQADIKDVGFLVGGPFEGTARRKDELICRSVVTLDVDHCTSMAGVQDLMDAYEGFEYILHSTHKHAPNSPRLRLVFPLTRDVSPFEYEPVARNLADWFGMDYFDDTTFEVSRIMYWPSRSSDGDYVAEHREGEWINPDDWEPDQDYMDWPRSSRVTEMRPPVAEAADPLTRPGLIGAFNRTYDIHAAITQYLPDVFETTEWDNRYRPLGATGPAGAIVYDDVFMYSHHENPAAISQKNCNAFDLVRLCLFGDDPDDETPVMQRHSVKEMLKLIAADPQVLANRELDDELDDIDDAAEVPPADKPAAPTADQFLIEIEGLTLPAGRESSYLDSLLPRIAQYEPHETDMLLKALQLRYPVKPGIQTLRDTVKRLRTQLAGKDGEDVADIERELVDEILDEHFGGGKHIRRIGKVFWAYRGGVWRIMGDEPVAGCVAKTLIRLREERPDEMAQLVAAIGESKTSALTGALLRMLINRLAEVDEASGNRDPLRLRLRITEPVINCQNCELHFERDGSITQTDHNPEHFYTHQVDTSYEPGADCPEWDRFMGILFSDCIDPDEMQRHFEELGGYIISMAKWLKTWVLFHGPTDTGKTTAVRVFMELLGSSCLSMEMGRFGMGNSFADSMLLGKLLLADDDFDKSASLPDGFMKKISEEKLITSDIKFGAAITFQARALPLICSNHWPPTRDVSDAFRDRALVFNFTHQIRGPEQSDRRRNEMLEELPGILNRFVDGLSRLRARGHWDVPIDALAAHDEWVNHSNVTNRYVHERMKRVDIGAAKRSDIWRDFKRWRHEEGGYAERMKQSEFFERLADVLRCPMTVYQGDPGFTGWTLLPPDDLEMFDGDIDSDRDDE